MAWPETLVLVRHGESEGNLLTTEQRADFPKSSHRYELTQRGRAQAVITGEYLNGMYPAGFDAYYVSYYRRSRETMKIMFPEARLYEDPRLAEAQRGIWHTLPTKVISQVMPYEIKRKRREDLYHYRPFGGENWPDVELRIHSFLGTLSRDYGGQRVVIVGHGHWLIMFQRLIHRLSIEEAMARYRTGVFANTSVTTYSGRSGRLELLEENHVPWEGLL
jgi:broad specificity phosphatase PhoE